MVRIPSSLTNVTSDRATSTAPTITTTRAAGARYSKKTLNRTRRCHDGPHGRDALVDHRRCGTRDLAVELRIAERSPEGATLADHEAALRVIELYRHDGPSPTARSPRAATAYASRAADPAPTISTRTSTEPPQVSPIS